MHQQQEKESVFEAAKEHTRRYAKNLWNIVNKYRQSASSQDLPATQHQLDKREDRHPALLQFLSLIPYVLGLLFLISFFWDFDDLQYTFVSHTFYFNGLMRILSVSGLIGFLTNWVAINMLFKPIRKRPILGQGLIPAQKNRIAFRLAQAVSDDLINPKIIKTKIRDSNLISIYRKRSTRYIKSIIDDPAFRAELKQWVVDYVEDMIGDPEIRASIAQKIIQQIDKSIRQNSLERVAIKAYSFIKGQKMQHMIENSLDQLPHSVESGIERFDELLNDLPNRIEANSETIEEGITTILYKLINRLDVHALVEDNLRQYDEQRISEIILKATNEQLRYIQYLGGILGLIGGLVIWEPLYSTLFLVISGMTIFILDNLLLKLDS